MPAKTTTLKLTLTLSAGPVKVSETQELTHVNAFSLPRTVSGLLGKLSEKCRAEAKRHAAHLNAPKKSNQ